MFTFRSAVFAGFAGALVLLCAPGAEAHFVLQAPLASSSQDVLGSPQKLGPCGDEAGGTPTSIVTTYQSGTTIDVTINETIFHPGHYRIALAVNDRSELPAEPIVTAGATVCGSVPIQSPPVFPILADGVLVHTTPFSEPQTVKITLPPNVTCTKCTLQVIEFMSNHGLNNPGGCFYHHCADLKLQTEPVVDSGTGGCACQTSSTTTDGAWLTAIAIVGGAVLRRRALSRARSLGSPGSDGSR